MVFKKLLPTVCRSIANFFQTDSRRFIDDKPFPVRLKVVYCRHTVQQTFSSQTLGGLLLNEAFRCFHLFVLCRTLSLISSQFRMCHKICLISSFGEVKTNKKSIKKLLFQIFENCVTTRTRAEIVVDYVTQYWRSH